MRLFDMDSKEDYLLDGRYKVCTPYAPLVDVVEVVRCKDCKWAYWLKTLNGEHRRYCMEHGSSGHTDDDYCSYGEREESEVEE